MNRQIIKNISNPQSWVATNIHQRSDKAHRSKIIHNTILSVFSFLSLFLFTNCAGSLVEVTVIDEKTALENQILGSYKELGKEVLLLASVRSIDNTGKLIKVPKVPKGKKTVIMAIQRSSFNRDDIHQYKSLGILGENNLGTITILSEQKIPAGKKDFLNNLVSEENSDREVIMRRVIEINENLSEEDMGKIRKVFASLNTDQASTGHMVQLQNGDWVGKQ